MFFFFQLFQCLFYWLIYLFPFIYFYFSGKRSSIYGINSLADDEYD
ncbi:unnamed protein product [Schistosoma mattheei]|uniref:Uncharacterized protein n=1 Tax=Schistosoma mattheei TaxID=31246 RepID=A0A183PNW7_9TREM|nr:unnamed protein product [Schistosoma mattheei]